jgi:phosphatidylserine/phosphatidylglycerophosphate/cardiolipin synthase-like enzyme
LSTDEAGLILTGVKTVVLLLVALMGCQYSTEKLAVHREPSSTPEPGGALDLAEDGGLWEVHFSPSGGCEDAIVRFIRSAKHSVKLQAYGFTSEPIIEALMEVGNRGLDVRVILDRSDEKQGHNEAITRLRNARVRVGVDRKHAIAHNKVIIVDDKSVETGSYNYTKQAEYSNAENCLILHDPALAKVYSDNFRNHQAHSVDD